MNYLKNHCWCYDSNWGGHYDCQVIVGLSSYKEGYKEDWERLLTKVDFLDEHTYHTWSSNGRWFVFASKRMDSLTARPFFAYFDEDGTIHKPFVMPQKDPTFYQSYLKTYNRPELITGPINIRPQVWVKTAYDNENRFDAKLDPNVLVRGPKEDEKGYNLAPN